MINKQIIFKKSPIGKTIGPKEIVYIYSESNFPIPDENNKINLESKHYILMNDVIITAKFNIPASVKISSNTLHACKLIFDAVGYLSFFETIGFNTKSLELENVFMQQIQAPISYFHVNSTTIKASNCIFLNGNIGDVNGYDICFDSCKFIGLTLGFHGLVNMDTLSIRNCIFKEWLNTSTIMTLHNVENIHISDNIFLPILNQAIFDFTNVIETQSILLSANQFHVLGALTGEVFILGSKDQTNPEIIAIGNTNLRDSTVLGQLKFNNNILETILTKDIPKIINAVYTTNARRERCITTSNGVMTYIGNAPQRIKIYGNFSISCINLNDFEFRIYLNNGTSKYITTLLNTTSNNIAVSMVVDVEKNDTIDMRVINLTSNDNIVCSSMAIISTK